MTQRALVRFFLLGLPIGLVISVVAGIYFYYKPLDVLPDRMRHQRQVAHLIRKSPTEKDLRDYRTILTTSLGSRTADQPDSLRGTAQWLASTLGPLNMGHTVEIVEGRRPQGERLPQHVLAELPGQRAAQQVLLVATDYSDAKLVDSAANTALLLSVANAFVKAPQRETVVFAFLDNTSADALETVVFHLQSKGQHTSAVLLIEGFTPDSTSLANASEARLEISNSQSPFARQLRESLLPRLPNGREEVSEPTRGPFNTFARLHWPVAVNDGETDLLSIAMALEGSLPSLANR